jgi:hypothetical protein
LFNSDHGTYEKDIVEDCIDVYNLCKPDLICDRAIQELTASKRSVRDSIIAQKNNVLLYDLLECIDEDMRDSTGIFSDIIYRALGYSIDSGQ